MYVNKFMRQMWLVLGAVLLVVPVASKSQQAEAPLLQRSLFADRKAHRVGDMLTVVVTEAASATATARTRADKEERVFGEINQPNEAPWNIDLGFGNQSLHHCLKQLYIFVTARQIGPGAHGKCRSFGFSLYKLVAFPDVSDGAAVRDNVAIEAPFAS